MKATSRMEGTTMMDSISKETRRRLIDEGYRLHMAIVAWGQKQGVRAYRVVPKDRSAYFEIYNPKTRKFSYEFPPKIKAAIDAHAEALAEYERWSRSFDRPRGRVLSDQTQPNDPERDNRTICDCNGGMRSTSPIKCDSDGVPAGDGLQAAQANGDGSQTDPASGASAKRPEVDFRT